MDEGQIDRSENLAIKVRGAQRSYGSLKVLKGLDMDAPYGSIYGLLGSSGCGKTTLLRCILGRLELSEGHVDVLGRPPGSKGHTIPGRGVGYMPQELALFGDFTTLETMYYFGILYGMSPKKVRERAEFLIQLLELPSVRKSIKKLSGGQQRRVSFAVAMLQEPPLLILDEPTVGVDPLLRAKIWEHLLELVQTSSTTIVITTHYIEEARQAHVVGLMRDGRLLAQSPPNALIEAHGMTTLEEVFLHLCREQNYVRPSELSDHSIQSDNGKKDKEDLGVVINEATPLLRIASTPQKSWTTKVKETIKTSCECGPCNPSTIFPRPRNVVALFWKNMTRIFRNPGLLLFQFVNPMIQIALFCLAIGRNLEGVKVAIVNNDIGYNNSILYHYCAEFPYMDNFGSLLVSNLDTKTFNLMYFSEMSEGVEQVKKGNAWAAIIIPENFTFDLTRRVMDMIGGKKVPREIITGSTIELYEDVTNLQMTFTLQNQTTNAIDLTLNTMIDSCNISKDELTSPIKVHDPPVYGNLHLSYSDYIAPGMIISVTFGISIALTALSFVTERKEGLLDRTWVAGVNVTEMVISQVLTQFFILLVQIFLLVIIVKFAFKIYIVHNWSFVLVAVLAILQGLTGMSYGKGDKIIAAVFNMSLSLGLLISSFCVHETSAMQLMAGSYYPALILSGVIWPLEGMPKVIRYISYGLPTTYAAEAMRSIMGRGWGLSELAVWRGFVMTIGWFLVFVILATVGLRLRK